MPIQQLLLGGGKPADPIYLDDIFKVWLHEGTGNNGGSAQTIVNGIDLAGKGGLVISKVRHQSYHWGWTDTERGVNKYLSTNDAGGDTTTTGNDQGITAFNNNGFTCGLDAAPGIINYSGSGGEGDRYVTYTFAKQKNFFDIVTYTGTGSARTIPHSLGSVPGAIFIKQLNATGDWYVYHREMAASDPAEKFMFINGQDKAEPSSGAFNDTEPTDSVFSVGDLGDTNGLDQTFVAYLFAHEEAVFGPNKDQKIISCGKYTANNSTTGPVVNLGFEPSFVLVKNKDSDNTPWTLHDNMRGVSDGGTDETILLNSNNAELDNTDRIDFNSTGFQLKDNGNYVNGGSDEYIYLAVAAETGRTIKPVTVGTKVFGMSNATGSSTIPNFASTFPVDFAFYRRPDTDQHWYNSSRLMKGKELSFNQDSAEGSWSPLVFDSTTGWQNHSTHGSDYLSWHWKRHAGFDIVSYTGNSEEWSTATQNITHNLGKPPEMIIIKNRSAAQDWVVYHHKLTDESGNHGSPEGAYIYLNLTNAENHGSTWWNNTAPTASVFSLGTKIHVNKNGQKFQALLFASVDGVSKVGGYDGNSGTKTVSCGFAPRFVMIKNANYSHASSNWYMYDTHRGIPAGNDNYLLLNKNIDEEGGDDIIDVDSDGFTINVDWASHNNSSYKYIYYAHA